MRSVISQHCETGAAYGVISLFIATLQIRAIMGSDVARIRNAGMRFFYGSRCVEWALTQLYDGLSHCANSKVGIDAKAAFGIMDSMSYLNTLTQYNGWTNYVTWLTNLHFYGEIEDIDAIREYIEERIDNVNDPFIKDLATFAYDLIDWEQLAEHAEHAEDAQ